MKVDEKKKYQDFINEVYVPIIVFSYSTGTIIAMNGQSRKMFGYRLSNVNELIGKGAKLWSMEQRGEYSLVEYDVVVKEKFSKQKYDCEYNIIYTNPEKKDAAIVVMIIECSYRDIFRDELCKLSPRLYWSYIGKNRQLEEDFYVSCGMEKRLKELFNTVNLSDLRYSMSHYEIEELEHANLRIINSHMPEPGSVRIIEVEGMTLYEKFRKIPVISADEKVSCIITMVSENVSTQEIVNMIDMAFFEKDMVNQIVDDGDSIYIICDMDEKRIIRYCSPNVSRMGYNYRSLKSGTHSVDELIAPGELEHFIGSIHLADIEGKERTEILSGYNFLKKDGSTVKMNVKLVLKRFAGGQKFCNLVVSTATKRRKTKGAIYDDGEKAAKYLGTERIIENAGTSILVLDSRDYTITRVNKMAEQTFGSRDSLVGMDIFAFYEKCNIEKQGPYMVDVKKKRYYVFSRSKKNEGKEKDIVVVTFTDITDIIMSEEDEGEGKNVYTLTGLRTRVQLEEDIISNVQKSLKQNKKSALIALDIDNFKNINAKFGYDVGDMILERFGTALENNRHFHNHCYRTNGDMFFIVADCEYDVDILVKEAMDTVNHVQMVENADIRLTVSCGIAYFPDEFHKTDNIIDCSVNALSRAKKMGRSKCATFKYVKGQEKYKKFLTDKMLKEFKDNYGNFEIYYEPVTNIMEDNITGARATIKWYDNRLGNITPYKYIEVTKMDVAEYLKYIVPVNEFMIKSALELCKRINEMYSRDFKMYIKASVFLLAREDFMIGFDRMIKNENINPANIIVDVSEGNSVNDYMAINLIIHSLHSIGCKVLVRESIESNFDSKIIDKMNVDFVCLDIEDVRKTARAGADKRRKLDRLCEKCNNAGTGVIVENVSKDEEMEKIKKITDLCLTGEIAGNSASANDFVKIYMRNR